MANPYWLDGDQVCLNGASDAFGPGAGRRLSELRFAKDLEKVSDFSVYFHGIGAHCFGDDRAKQSMKSFLEPTYSRCDDLGLQGRIFGCNFFTGKQGKAGPPGK